MMRTDWILTAKYWFRLAAFARRDGNRALWQYRMDRAKDARRRAAECAE